MTPTTTEVSEAMVERAAKIIDPQAWIDRQRYIDRSAHWAGVAINDAQRMLAEKHKESSASVVVPSLKTARAALEAALSTAPSGDGVPGMVPVPREPTDAMLHAAINAIPMDKYIDVGARRSKVTLSTDECATIYRAMLSSASSTGKETP